MQPTAATLRFPYMFWAHTESFRSPYCLAQSGMPVPDAPYMRLEPHQILTFPAVSALPALEQRIAELFGVAPERVLATVGASAALELAAACWFRAPARVLAETPAYEPLRALPPFFGAERLDLVRSASDDWAIDVDRARGDVASASRATHAVLTNPHNPSGCVESAETVRALATALEPRGGRLVSCEIYMEYAPHTDQRVHAALVAPNAISIGGLTKAYGLGALRVGWILFGEDVVQEREQFVDLQYLTYVDPPSASLEAARIAFDHLPELLAPLRRVEHESRPQLIDWLRTAPGIEACIPPFGIIAFPRVVGVDDTHALQRYLQAEHQVDVVAGEYFDRPGHLRVACGVPEATLREGLTRLTAGIEAFRAER